MVVAPSVTKSQRSVELGMAYGRLKISMPRAHSLLGKWIWAATRKTAVARGLQSCRSLAAKRADSMRYWLNLQGIDDLLYGSLQVNPMICQKLYRRSLSIVAISLATGRGDFDREFWLIPAWHRRLKQYILFQEGIGRPSGLEGCLQPFFLEVNWVRF
jgi:hypothetical protein